MHPLALAAALVLQPALPGSARTPAYAPDGLAPEAFTAQSAYRRALAEAEAAYRHSLDWVRHRRPCERTP